jgi:hypothetical protein
LFQGKVFLHRECVKTVKIAGSGAHILQDCQELIETAVTDRYKFKITKLMKGNWKNDREKPLFVKSVVLPLCFSKECIKDSTSISSDDAFSASQEK